MVVLMPLLGCLGYLLSAVWVFRRRYYRPRAAWLAFVYCGLSFLWSLAQALAQLDHLPRLLSGSLASYGPFILAIVFLLLTQALVDGRGWPLTWLALGIFLAAGLALILTGLVPLPETLLLLGGRTLDRSDAINIVSLLGWFIFMCGSAWQIIWAARRTAPHRTLLSYWSFTLALVIAGDGLFFAGYLTWGSLLRLAGVLLAAYVVSAPRLPVIGYSLRRWSTSLLYAALAIGLYAAGLALVQVAFASRGSPSPIWYGWIAAAVLALLFNPLLGVIQKRLNRWIAGKAQDPTTLLRRYSQSITHILDLNKLAMAAVGAASEFLQVGHGFLFLVEREKNGDAPTLVRLRGLQGAGEAGPEPGLLQPDSPLVAYFQGQAKPVTQLDLEIQPRFRLLARQERQWLAGLGVEVFVPIYAKNEWIGLLALGPKRSGAEFTAQDLSLLSTLADQTAVALENARLVEGLLRLNKEFRRAYAALDQANRHLERLDKTKSDFISIASHELRTPLTLISGANQVLLDDLDLVANPYHQQLLDKIHTGSIRLHEIIEAMLDMAKIDTRDLALEPQPISLSSLIRSVCNERKKDAEERKQTIVLQGLEDLPSITADMLGLRKVFYHLVINAIKYTPDGGGITITGYPVAPQANNLPLGGVEIVVSDTGIGIDPRYHELIFTKFYQTGELELHSSGKTKFKGGGPGLGLAIAKGIVEAHHGRIWVVSPGYDEVKCPGSQFHVILPLRPTDRPNIS
jgi:signal transduction histidine kinase